MDIYIDTETVPSQRPEIRTRLIDEHEAQARAAVPPSSIANLKTEQLRAEREDAWRHGLIEGAMDNAEQDWRRTSLDGGYGELICMSWAVGDGQVTTVSRENLAPHAERSMLSTFWIEIERAQKAHQASPIRWCGHNVIFDLKFLHHRSIIRGTKPSVSIPHNEAPWRNRYVDTMYEWAGARDRVRLTVLCDILGIVVNDQIDGSQVWDAFCAGHLDQIIEHCEADVRRVREIVRMLEYRS